METIELIKQVIDKATGAACTVEQNGNSYTVNTKAGVITRRDLRIVEGSIKILAVSCTPAGELVLYVEPKTQTI